MQCASLPGMALSQTTLTPAVVNTTLMENGTSLTVTPVMLSTTAPGCLAFNTSTCEPCAPGSQYDNSESITMLHALNMKCETFENITIHYGVILF